MQACKGRKALHLTLIVACLVLMSGCSVVRSQAGSSSRWLPSGSLALSRPMPLASRAQAVLHPQAESALANAGNSPDITALIISRRDRTLTALRPGSSPLVIKTDGAQFLQSGSFSVTQKELGPLWYAPKEYFTSRALPIPPEGSRGRFKRAALGPQTIYLNDQTPIHSGPVWLKEIGGLRVKSSAMNQLYSMVQVGARVEVK
jgi:hypothetical protein